MAGEEGAAFSAGRKIFRHCYCVDEDTIAAAGKGRLHYRRYMEVTTPYCCY
jgi:hypothetical protein